VTRPGGARPSRGPHLPLAPSVNSGQALSLSKGPAACRRSRTETRPVRCGSLLCDRRPGRPRSGSGHPRGSQSCGREGRGAGRSRSVHAVECPAETPVLSTALWQTLRHSAESRLARALSSPDCVWAEWTSNRRAWCEILDLVFLWRGRFAVLNRSALPNASGYG